MLRKGNWEIEIGSQHETKQCVFVSVPTDPARHLILPKFLPTSECS